MGTRLNWKSSKVWYGLFGLLGGLLALALLAPLTPRAQERSTDNTLTRLLEPVVMRGDLAANFYGQAVDELFLYRYVGDTWEQIPMQVDEVNGSGAFVAREDLIFDGNDEVVFMARDAGQRPPANRSIGDALEIGSSWYEIEISDPFDSTRAGWVYLVHSSSLNRTTTTDYVSFDGGLHRLSGKSYRLGLSVTMPGADYLTIGQSTMDILDRTKIRINCNAALFCPITDNALAPVADNLIKDGPVRVILRGGDLLGYGYSYRWSWAYRNSPDPVRFSYDFNANVVGARLFTESAPTGVVVDGVPDVLPAQPAATWWQMNTDTGSLFFALDTSVISGTVSTFYQDNAITRDNGDTGDFRHYGDIGPVIENAANFTYRYTVYATDQPRPNIGAAFAAYQATPLRIRSLQRGQPFVRHTLYAPAVLRGDGAGGSSFYTPPPGGVSGQTASGTLLRSERISTYSAGEVSTIAGTSSSNYGADVYRVLYTSQAPAGTPRAVSGLLLLPTSTGAGGEDQRFPLLVQGNLRLDQGDECAPSKSDLSALASLGWVAEGYMVLLSDYAGLGTQGARPTLVGETEAWNLLDGARAVLQLSVDGRRPAENRVLFMGHSMAGHGALFAAEQWRDYAPELNLLGTVLYSPVSEMATVARNLVTAPTLVAPLVMTMHAYSTYYGGPAPESWLKQPFATEIDQQLNQGCLLQVGAWLGNYPERVFDGVFLAALQAGRWQDLAPWTTYIEDNTPGKLVSERPVLIIAGEVDVIHPPAATQQLVDRLCAAGGSVAYELYPGAGHFSTPMTGRVRATTWMAQRLADGQPESICP